SSPMPTGRRRVVSPAPAADSGTGGAPAPTRAVAETRARGSSRTTVSTRVFHSPHERHWPSQRGTAAPQDWQTKRLWTRATRATRCPRSGFDRRLRLGGRDDQAGAIGIKVDRDRVALVVPT